MSTKQKKKNYAYCIKFDKIFNWFFGVTIFNFFCFLAKALKML